MLCAHQQRCENVLLVVGKWDFTCAVVYGHQEGVQTLMSFALNEHFKDDISHLYST